jgi:hypothetical protein
VGTAETISDRLANSPVAMQRMVAFLCLLGVVAGFVAAGLLVRHAFASQEHWRVESRRTLANAKAMIQAQAKIEAAQLAMKGNAELAHYYEPVEGLGAIVQITKDLSGLGASAGVTGIQVEPGAETKGEGLRVHQATVRGRADAAQLHDFAERLRAHSKLLKVRSVQLTSPFQQLPEVNSTVDITMTVLGYERR